MRSNVLLALAGALMVSGCAYWPRDPDPIRLSSSPAEVGACRRLGSVGITRTDGVDHYGFADLMDLPPAVSAHRARSGPPGRRFDERLAVLKAEAIRRGATDLLLSRRLKGDWSYIEAIAYRCRR